MAALGENLLEVVNKLQDLVFNTIGNDSLDLPQIVRFCMAISYSSTFTDIVTGCRGLAILRKIISP